jgi:hypothetical protein
MKHDSLQSHNSHLWVQVGPLDLWQPSALFSQGLWLAGSGYYFLIKNYNFHNE